MSQQILFIGGPRDETFDDVPTPLPDALSVMCDDEGAVVYELHYIVEVRRRYGDRRWPVYVNGPLPPPSSVLPLWYARATMWQLLPGAAPLDSLRY